MDPGHPGNPERPVIVSREFIAIYPGALGAGIILQSNGVVKYMCYDYW